MENREWRLETLAYHFWSPYNNYI